MGRLEAVAEGQLRAARAACEQYAPLGRPAPFAPRAEHVALVLQLVDQHEAENRRLAAAGDRPKNYVAGLIRRLRVDAKRTKYWGPLDDPQLSRDYLRASIFGPLQRVGRIVKYEDDADANDAAAPRKRGRPPAAATASTLELAPPDDDEDDNPEEEVEESASQKKLKKSKKEKTPKKEKKSTRSTRSKSSQEV